MKDVLNFVIIQHAQSAAERREKREKERETEQAPTGRRERFGLRAHTHTHWEVGKERCSRLKGGLALLHTSLEDTVHTHTNTR